MAHFLRSALLRMRAWTRHEACRRDVGRLSIVSRLCHFGAARCTSSTVGESALKFAYDFVKDLGWMAAVAILLILGGYSIGAGESLRAIFDLNPTTGLGARMGLLLLVLGFALLIGSLLHAEKLTLEARQSVKDLEISLAAAIKRGTAIATFDANKKYPTDKLGQHAAIYLSHSDKAITVLDQWAKQGKVAQRDIRFNRAEGTKRSDNGDTFFVID
jgi:hypothetical protein